MDAYLPPFWPTVVVLALLLSLAGLGWIARHHRNDVRMRMTDRLILGIPWGSIISITIVLAVYFIVQDGMTTLDRPVYLPFVNWSYLYPTGVVFGGFAHASTAHLVGNLTTAAILAPLAEYIWGHYTPHPQRRILEHPIIRATVIFPGAIIIVGLCTSLFSWGPVIGFSGVVFALAGFTVIRFPILTIVALLARSAVREIGGTLFNPVVEATAGVTMTLPSWVGISFQGHAFGFLLGAFLGILLLHSRAQKIDPMRLWIGATLVMISMGLWAIWGTRGEDVYVLYRGLGFALLFLAALLITIAATSSEQQLFGWLTRRRVAILGLAIPLLILGGIAIPLNLISVAEHDSPENAITVDGYDVYYTQHTENQLRPVLFPDNGEGSNASGLILVNEARHMWAEGIGSDDLAFSGEETVALGGIASRTEVTAYRSGWNPAGNESVYRVDLEVDEQVTPTFASEKSTVEHRIGGHQVSLGAELDGDFFLSVTTATGESVRATIPPENTSTRVGELTILREGDTLFAEYEETSVRIAEREHG